MSSNYRLRSRAKLDIELIVDYLAARSPSTSLRFIDAIEREFGFLSDFPQAGGIRDLPQSAFPGLRSWPIKGFGKYLIFYRPTDSGVEIVRVLHGSRDVDAELSAEA